eukprot:TRINITY_DN15729_c0_g1_i1.p1 TRINITY_DN15729_c0_g1~~TRINITY_DN15729_c0_g1_i1.p1  ORF type:complete len:323 (-),score=76.52 TRINITY_DN15729_c0_g1_i1:15-983(-)
MEGVPFTKRLDDCKSFFTLLAHDMTERMKEGINLCSSLSHDIENRLSFLHKQELNRKHWEQKIEQQIEKQQDQITMNVGGTLFTTLKSTLGSMEGTFFHAMVSSDRWKPDTDGHYFIDRDPKHFRRILEYLKTKEIDFDDLSKREQNELEFELDFYEVLKSESKQEEWEWDPLQTGKNLELSKNNTTVTKTSSKGWNSAVLANQYVDRFTIKIVKRSDGDAMIGMAPVSFDKNGNNFRSCGYYLHIGIGSLFSQGNRFGRPFTNSIQEKSLIEVYYDRKNGTIRFKVNDVDLGIAFENIPNQTLLFPCLEISSVDFCAEIVQ